MYRYFADRFDDIRDGQPAGTPSVIVRGRYRIGKLSFGFRQKI
jgi:hypothetical protein